MREIRDVGRHWLLKRIDHSIRVGLVAAERGIKDQDIRHLGMGVGLVVYGLMKRRRVRTLIYATSLDVDQGMSIRVMQGRKSIAQTAPLP